jgi:two-component system cell cycle sensor histidine kinase/response regulator CckA
MNFIYTFLIFYLLLLLGGSYLVVSLKPCLLTFSILVLQIFFGLYLCFMYFKSRSQFFFTSRKLEDIELALSQMGERQEMAIFDIHGQTIFTTHPLAYPNKTEFIRKLLSRFDGSKDLQNLKTWIEDFQYGQALLSACGNGLGENKKWVVVSAMPVFEKDHGLEKLQIITVSDLTEYLENQLRLERNQAQVEAFIDHAPFGIFYLNATGHLVGLNQTFAEWLGQDKERLMGQKIESFAEGIQLGALNPAMVTLKHIKNQSVKALWFPPKKEEGKIQASLLCRMDGGEANIENAATPDTTQKGTFSHSLIPGVFIDEKAQILGFNRAFETLVDGKIATSSPLKVGEPFVALLSPKSRQEFLNKVEELLKRPGGIPPFEFHFEGGQIQTTAYMSLIPHELGNSQPAPVLIQFIDISQQKHLELQFIQSQKMQAVGQLAGGIAHDFNNLLTAMIGFCDLLLQRYMPNDPSYTDVMQIKQNANRAANLVRQLLAFSRQQTLQPKVINITDVLAELSALLRRLIGATITLNMNHGRDLWPVKVDASQLEQVIINLAVNARDAMANGGTLTIKTSCYHCTKAEAIGHDTMMPGEYVLIEVEDTGHGIKPEDISRIFEPFFSTKEIGAGTGLGLSTVYGIVKQTGGFVGIASQVGKGSTFKIYLPRHLGEIEIFEESNSEKMIADLTGKETVLLVEDEDAVRLFSARALREKGYEVLEAEGGEEALEIVESGAHFDILVTDVVMPKMDGPTLSKKVREKLPDCKIIFISGYAEDTFRKNLDSDSHIHFLPKPFTLKDLAQKVRDVLGKNN